MKVNVKRFWRSAVNQSSSASQNRWRVARECFRAQSENKYSRGRMQELANVLAAVERGNTHQPEGEEATKKNPTDTVYRLASAYWLFAQLLRIDAKKARAYRRKYPYTRWAIVSAYAKDEQFPLPDAFQWLDYEGGNKAVELALEDANGTPEWERAGRSIYNSAKKIVYGAPLWMKRMAQAYVKAYDKWAKEQK